jgi:asparagine synthase (glutamine-hydrolysing)
MCGICGLVAPGGTPDPGLVERMCAAIVHRGPDHGAVGTLGRCALGYRRLRVIDLETGDQPVANERGDVVAVFNGEIYNFRELREELDGREHEVRGTGDTPILPHLYEEEDLRFLERLSGMFAIALWDSRRERLVLARDRLGKKPLLWTQLADGTVAFASEVKALLQLPGVERTVDLDAIDAYLSLQYVPCPRTALRGIEKVPPGSMLVVEDGLTEVIPYWEPRPAAVTAASEDEWLSLVREAVTASVRKRLVADVPLGALLSGGIDSSMVVSVMAQAASEPVRTFTVGFGDARYDEREHARAVARRYGTTHEEIEVDVGADPAATVARLAAAYDEPLGDEAALPQLLISEIARRHVTVALVGDGGDEAFAGYERYAAVGLADRVPAGLARPAAALLRRLPAARREPRSAAFRAARFLEAASVPAAERYGRLVEVFPAELRSALWSDDALRELGSPRTAAALLGRPPRPGVAGLQELDLRTYLPGDLLLKTDIASMAHSLELRSPLLDHEVVELGLALPPALKLKGREGKQALRRAFAADLPPGIAERAKTGFGVPISRWFRSELRELTSDVLLDDRARGRGWFRPAAVERLLADHAAGRADHAHRLWCLLMLELWQRLHVETPATATATATA